MARDGEASEALPQQRLRLLKETVVQIVGHAEDEETVRILLHDLRKVVILDTVDKLLYDNSCRHLGIVHIRKEHLGSIPSVDHKRRQHLHLFTEEERAPVTKCTDRLSVPLGVLPKPQMTMRINDRK